MRRSVTALRILTPALALGLILSGCSSTSGTKKTVTVMETHTSAPAPAGSGAAGGSITVGQPTGSVGGAAGSGAAGSRAAGSGAAGSGATGSGTAGSGAAGSGAVKPSGTAGASTTKSPAKSTAKSTAKPTTSAPATTAKVNPLTVDCASLLSPADVKKLAGQAIPAATQRIKDVANAKVGSTGAVRCLYGVANKAHKVSVRLTKYSTPAAAAKQVSVTVKAETDLGAKASESTVGGQKAHVLLRDGGLIDVQYGDWTLALAVPAGFLKGDQPAQLTKLADLALARVIKNAG